MIGWWKPIFAYVAATATFVIARTRELISTSDLVTGLAVVIGALPAVYLAAVQIRESQAENDRIRAAELRRGLEVDAFKTLTCAIVRLTKQLSEIGSIYGVAVVMLRDPYPKEPTLRDLMANHTPRARRLPCEI